MARRKESKLEKLRGEEDELDKQLKDAGLYEEGMSVDMKKIMLEMVNESRETAQQEERRRHDMEKQEQQLLNETLGRSCNSPEASLERVIRPSNVQTNEDNSSDSDVVAISAHDDEQRADPDCLSVTQSQAEASDNHLTTETEGEPIAVVVGVTNQIKEKEEEKVAASSSKAEENSDLVPCPLCQNLYPKEQIEVHASDCSDIPSESPPRQQPKEEASKGKRKRGQRAKESPELEVEQVTERLRGSGVTISQASRTPAGHEKCSFCKRVFKEGADYYEHVQSCLKMKQIQSTIVSPASTTTQG